MLYSFIQQIYIDHQFWAKLIILFLGILQFAYVKCLEWPEEVRNIL